MHCLQYLEWDLANEAQVNSFIAGYWDLQSLTTARRKRHLLHTLWQSTISATTASISTTTIASSDVHSVKVPIITAATTTAAAAAAAVAATTVQQ